MGYWFDTVSEARPSGPEIDAILVIVCERFRPVTKARFMRVRKILATIEAPWVAPVIEDMDALTHGGHRRDFRYMWNGTQLSSGNYWRMSASSVFFSFLRQALAYR